MADTEGAPAEAPPADVFESGDETSPEAPGGAALPGGSGDAPEAIPVDKEAQIMMEERETVSEAVPGGMFGAVMVEVCVTLPRAR